MKLKQEEGDGEDSVGPSKNGTDQVKADIVRAKEKKTNLLAVKAALKNGDMFSEGLFGEKYLVSLNGIISSPRECGVGTPWVHPTPVPQNPHECSSFVCLFVCLSPLLYCKWRELPGEKLFVKNPSVVSPLEAMFWVYLVTCRS